MKKLIQILAVSAGGGLLFGAGMRLAEKQGAPEAGDAAEVPEDRISLVLGRLETLEKRVEAQGWPTDEAGCGARAEATPRPAGNARAELQADIAASLREMEERLHKDLADRSDTRLRSMGDALQVRLEQRLAPLEAELSAQRAAVEELRECSLRTDRNLQKLLLGMDKLVAAQPAR